MASNFVLARRENIQLYSSFHSCLVSCVLKRKLHGFGKNWMVDLALPSALIARVGSLVPNFVCGLRVAFVGIELDS